MSRLIPWGLAERKVWRALVDWRNATEVHRKAEDALLEAILHGLAGEEWTRISLRDRVERLAEQKEAATVAYYAAKAAVDEAKRQAIEV